MQQFQVPQKNHAFCEMNEQNREKKKTQRNDRNNKLVSIEE